MKIIFGLLFLGVVGLSTGLDLPKIPIDLPKTPKGLPKTPKDLPKIPIDLPKTLKNVASLPCGGFAELGAGQEVTIETPNYPSKYSNNENCTWELLIPSDETAEMFCEYFHLKRNDYLEIVNIYQPFNGYASNGFSVPIPVDFDGSDGYLLQLRFTSNRWGQGNGFRCQIDTEASTIPTTSAPATTNAASNPATSAPATTSAPVITAAPATTAAPSSSCQCGIPNRSNRIVGGVETEVNEYPWQVALVRPNGRSPFCGGTLISDRHIMTAAHCTAGQSASGIRILLGEHKTNDAKQVVAVVATITDDPLYNSNTMRNDFSILTLEEPVTFTREISPACLPSYTTQMFAGQVATVSGWGTLKSNGNQPTVLMEVDVTVTTEELCKSVYGNGISSINICAMDAGKDSCQGDSGGPLVIQENGRFALIGVVSYGYGCASPNIPGVYARVSDRKAWIEATASGTQDSMCSLVG